MGRFAFVHELSQHYESQSSSGRSFPLRLTAETFAALPCNRGLCLLGHEHLTTFGKELSALIRLCRSPRKHTDVLFECESFSVSTVISQGSSLHSSLEAFSASCDHVWRTAKREGWVDVAKYTRPWLTDEQILARLKWAAEKLKQSRQGLDPCYCVVDIDEKIFRCFKRKRKAKKDP